MRDKIAKVVKAPILTEVKVRTILALIREEIEKAENPHPQDYQSSNGDFYDAIEEFRQAILKALEV